MRGLVPGLSFKLYTSRTGGRISVKYHMMVDKVLGFVSNPQLNLEPRSSRSDVCQPQGICSYEINSYFLLKRYALLMNAMA